MNEALSKNEFKANFNLRQNKLLISACVKTHPSKIEKEEDFTIVNLF